MEGKTTYHIDTDVDFDIFLLLKFEKYCAQTTNDVVYFDLMSILEYYGVRYLPGRC